MDELDEQINQFLKWQSEKKKKPKVETRRSIEDIHEQRRLEREFGLDS